MLGKYVGLISNRDKPIKIHCTGDQELHGLHGAAITDESDVIPRDWLSNSDQLNSVIINIEKYRKKSETKNKRTLAHELTHLMTHGHADGTDKATTCPHVCFPGKDRDALPNLQTAEMMCKSDDEINLDGSTDIANKPLQYFEEAMEYYMGIGGLHYAYRTYVGLMYRNNQNNSTIQPALTKKQKQRALDLFIKSIDREYPKKGLGAKYEQYKIDPDKLDPSIEFAVKLTSDKPLSKQQIFELQNRIDKYDEHGAIALEEIIRAF
ncbi:MAG: hypothetical protein AB8E15_11915 [Bdellovibrionales bacterium]